MIALYIAIPILGTRTADIERLATQILHHPVKIESSKGIWLDTEPGVMLKNLVVLDEQSKEPTLKISELQVGFKILASLWQKTPVVGHLYINGANINVQQISNNQIIIKGLPEINQKNSPSFDSLSELFQWIMLEHEIKLDHITIDWQKPDGSKINIPYFFLTSYNYWHEHRGNLKICQTNLGALLKEYNIKGWQITSGKINKLNLHWGFNYHNFKYLKGSIDANNFTIIQPNLLPPSSAHKTISSATITWQFNSLLGHFLWHGKINDQWLLKLQRLEFNLDGQNWLEKNLQINALPIKKGGCLYTIHASNLHLANLWLPLTKLGKLSIENQKLIKHLNLQGDLKNIFLEYPYAATESKATTTFPQTSTTSSALLTKPVSLVDNKLSLNWKFAAEIHNFNINPWQKIPGIQQLSGYLQIANEMGQFRLDSEKSTLIFPKHFRSPIFFENAQANIDWQILPNGYKINAVNAQINNSDAKFKGDMSLWLPSNDQSPFINLFGEFTINANAKISTYLPIAIITPDFIKWFDQAFLSIAGGNGTLILHGPLKNFPFPKKEGTFAVHAQINDVTFRCLPNWPVIKHIFAKLNFDGPKMSALINSGKVFSSQIKSAYAEIPVILKGIDAALHVQADIVGDLRDGARFIAQSPLNKKFSSTLSPLKIDGDSEIKLTLDTNLENDNVPTKVHGNIDMSEATVALPFKQLIFENISGILHFTQDGIETSVVQAEFLHEPITININNDQGTQTLLQFNGNARILDLQKTFGLSRLPNIEGNFAYQTKLSIPQGANKKPNSLLITSTLKGIKINLPAPFNKSANDITPSQALITLGQNSPPLISFKYANKLNGILQYYVKNFEFDRGNISIGTDTAELPSQPGLWITGSLPNFNWEEWKRLFQSSKKNSTSRSTTLWPKILKQISLQFNNIQLLQQNFQNIKFDLSRTENNWLLGLNSANIIGKITIPDDKEAAWNAHFEKLYLQTNNQTQKSTLTPTDIPALNCFVHDFHYGNKQLGQAQLVLAPLENGLKIQRLSAESPAFALLAQGNWQMFAKRQYSNLSGQVTIHDIGSTLVRLGMPASVVGKNGKLSFNLGWSTPPYDPLIPSLSGYLDIALDNGRIVDIGEENSQKIGMGKLLNFFSLQNLPRHLTLDFSDVSKQGFPFDIMRGHFMLKNGNAYTKDTYWDGPVALISMKGNISLANENYDLYLSVTPQITSSLPIVATIAGGPVVGLTTWVADKLLSKQVGKLMTYSYHMHGPWSKASLTEA